jgi:hypothetical protein
MAKKKKREPQDSTRRNVQAANKRLDKLESAVHTLTDRIEALEDASRPRVPANDAGDGTPDTQPDDHPL